MGGAPVLGYRLSKAKILKSKLYEDSSPVGVGNYSQFMINEDSSDDDDL